MSQTVTVDYSYDVEAISRSVRKTNVFLRGINALRLTVQDLKTTLKATIANVFWTLIQLTRTYNALKRLMNEMFAETSQLLRGAGHLQTTFGLGAAMTPRKVGQQFALAFGDVRFDVDATINNTPVPIEIVDLSGIEELTIVKLQEIMEAEAPRTVEDAKRILSERIIHRERSTGRLGRSIRWFSSLPGVTVEATAPYSFWVEEGHRSFSGHHFLRDAQILGVERISQRIQIEIDELISTRRTT
jgi:hypothetical protein